MSDDVYFDCINCEEEMPEAERHGNCRTCGGPLCLKCAHVTDCDTCSDYMGTPPTESQLKRRFARNLRDARKAAGLSKKELAKKINVNEFSIQRMESGNSYPSLLLLVKLSKALDTSDTELLKE